MDKPTTAGLATGTVRIPTSKDKPYVEARVGSANHRGECVRCLWNGNGCNEAADDVIRALVARVSELEAARLSAVRVSTRPVARTDGGPDWFTLRVENGRGGSMDFGFEPTEDDVVRKWAYEATVFAVEWSTS